MSLLILLSCTWLSLAEAITVRTQYGDVESFQTKLHNDAIVNVFLGIPYAKSPEGHLRFKKPEAPENWQPFTNSTGPLPGRSLGKQCPQDNTFMSITNSNAQFGEDCLNLNVFTPEEIFPGKNYPVIFYIHGGSYHSSGNAQYPGHFLAARGVVVVVANFRLGQLGFLSTGDSAAWGNWGMWDQILALKWTRDNIQKFGGDSEKITVAGHDSGASSASLHLLSSKSKYLYTQMLVYSGSYLSPWAVNLPQVNPEQYAREVAQQLGCTTNDNVAMIDCYRTKSPSELLATTFTCQGGGICKGFAPVVDNAAGFLPGSPSELPTVFPLNAFMSGASEAAGALELIAIAPDTKDSEISDARFSEILSEKFVPLLQERLPTMTHDDILKSLLSIYTQQFNGTNRMALAKLISDMYIYVHMSTQLRDQVSYAHAQNFPTSVYQFVNNYRSKVRGQSLEDWIGSTLLEDVAFVFGYPFLKLNPEVRQQMGIREIMDFNDEDRAYSEFTQTLWANFASKGHPTPEPIDLPSGGKFDWPEYDLETERFASVGHEVIIKDKFNEEFNNFWSTMTSQELPPDSHTDRAVNAMQVRTTIDKLYASFF